jgi:hypothetical protein
MVDERIALFIRDGQHICEGTVCRSQLQGGLDMAGLLANSGGDPDKAERWASVAADNLRCYVRA